MSKANEHDTQAKMTGKQYGKELRKLQTELCRLQEWAMRAEPSCWRSTKASNWSMFPH